jgi:hypothetical protein
MARYTDIDKLIAEYDRVHIGPAGGARKLMVEAPIADVAPRAEVEGIIYKLECLLCHATGSKLSKHTYDLRTMETAVTDYINESYDEGYRDAKSEVAREIFQEIYADLFRILPLKVFHLISGDIVGDRFDAGKERALHDVIHCVAELEKKYAEGQK